MTRRRAVRLALAGIAALLVTGLVAGTVLTIVYLRRPFPEYGGEVAVPGLRSSVTVLRDDQGVPHVYADDAESLFRAQGYVHAQDRFFEMDLRRRAASGRLAELVGDTSGAVASDTTVRILGWRQTAEKELELVSPSTRVALDAYAAGVNDYLRGRSLSQLSVNYTMLGVRTRLPRLDSWSAVDSLTWFKAVAWQLGPRRTDELDRARIFATVKDVARVKKLYPAYPHDEHRPVVDTTGTVRAAVPVTSATGMRAAVGDEETAFPSGPAYALSTDGGQSAVQQARRVLDAIPTLFAGDVAGGNALAVAGDLTTTGSPLLAADAHLATALPGVLYQVGLHCRNVSATCPYDVSGFSTSGMPGVLSGHNARLAWSVSSANVDTTDYYLEIVLEGSYVREGQVKPLDSRVEEIQVAGGSPVKVVVRSTGHGPLLSDVDNVSPVDGQALAPGQDPIRLSGFGISLAWTGLRPGRSMDALLGMNAASTVQQLRASAALMSAPALSVVFAESGGQIGYQLAGRVPVRKAPDGEVALPTDGTWPMSWWESRDGWLRYVPAAKLPAVVDPPEGFVVAAGQAVTGRDAAVPMPGTWDYGYRSQRVRTLLAQAVKDGGQLSVEDLGRFQTDTYNGIAAELVPLLLAQKVDTFTRQGQQLLRDWDYTQPADSASAAYFNAVWAELLDLTFADELSDGTEPDGGDRWFEVVRQLLKRPRDSWWDDRRTPNVIEARDEILRRALVQARLRLTSQLGKDPERWRWGKPHSVELAGRPLDQGVWPAPMRWLLDRGPYEVAGGPSSVSAYSWDAADGSFRVGAGPSMRMIVDLADFDRSRWINQTGVSGHPLNAHYDDQIDAWRSGRTRTWPFSEDAVREAKEDELRLVPAG